MASSLKVGSEKFFLGTLPTTDYRRIPVAGNVAAFARGSGVRYSASFRRSADGVIPDAGSVTSELSFDASASGCSGSVDSSRARGRVKVNRSTRLSSEASCPKLPSGTLRGICGRFENESGDGVKWTARPPEQQQYEFLRDATTRSNYSVASTVVLVIEEPSVVLPPSCPE